MEGAAEQHSPEADTQRPRPATDAAAALYALSRGEIDHLRAQIRSKERRPYEDFETITARGSTAVERAEQLLSAPWRRDGQALERLAPPLPWDGLGRSFSYRLHSFEPLSVLLGAHQASGERKYFDRASEIALSWIEEFQQPLFSSDLRRDADRARAVEGTMAWHDMAVGLRAYRMAYMLDVLARDDARATSHETVQKFLRSLVLHQALLSEESFFASHSNHGFYQAIGQLAAARRFDGLPGFDSYVALAEQRVRLMFGRNFFPSGPHKEHSPNYHYVVLGTARGALRSGLLDRDTAATLSAAEIALGWMTQPDGARVPFGDTDPVPGFFSAEAARQFEDPGVRAVLTGGTSPGPVPTGVKVYDDAGYVFARVLPDGQPGAPGRASYFAQMAGFHSRTHKHADHLSFVWMEEGRSILVDPGRFGYVGKTAPGDELSRAGFYYSDPRRVYVERTRAHNCVEIDGQDHARKDVEPFGSAVVAAAERNGLVASLCELRHPGGVTQRRLVILLAGCFLVTVDGLRDRKRAAHTFRQRFQLAPEWRPAAAERGVLEFFHGDSGEVCLSAASLIAGARPDKVRIGETEPEMAGWCSDGPSSLVPSPSLNWHRAGTARAEFATLFSIGGDLEVDHDESFVAPDHAEGRLCWTDARGRNVLTFARAPDSAGVVVTYSCPDAGREETLTADGAVSAGQARHLRERIAGLEDRLEDAALAKAAHDERIRGRTPGPDAQRAAAGVAADVAADAAVADLELKVERLERRLQVEGELRAQAESAAAATRALETQLAKLRSSVRYRLGSKLVDLPRSPFRAWNAARQEIAARRNVRLLTLLESFGQANTGVRLETYSRQIAGCLAGGESDQVAEDIERGAADDALATVCRIAAGKPGLSAPALLHLRRAEAVVRCAREGVELPERAATPAYDVEPRRVFYVTHMRAPIVRNGYVTRTHTVMNGLRSAGLDPIGVTRLGFPYDLTATERAGAREDEVYKDMRFLALFDHKGGLRGRPIDDYVTAYAQRLRELALEHRPAVLHAASNYMNGLAAIVAGRQLGIPVIYEARGLWQLTAISRDPAYENTERCRLENRLEQQAAAEADLNVVISEGLGDYFAECGVPAERLFVVPNGVDAEEFRPGLRDEALARELGLGADVVVVGYIGSLLDYEGIDLVLSAVAELRRQGHERLRALIVGRGRDGEALQAHARSLGIAGACLFTGSVPPDQVPRYYSLIDIAPFARKLQPVTKLVPPLKPMEAMAMERATIVSDLPALVDIGEDGVSALHVRHDDVGSLVEAIGALAGDPDRRRAVASAGRRWVAGERSLEAIGGRLARAYATLGLPRAE